jgi:hypothetical protein
MISLGSTWDQVEINFLVGGVLGGDLGGDLVGDLGGDLGSILKVNFKTHL